MRYIELGILKNQFSAWNYIRNNPEIYFLIDGYAEKFRNIHSTHILKWAIIKKYYERGYRIFNLGEVHKNYLDKSNKYHGQFMYKIGFCFI